MGYFLVHVKGWLDSKELLEWLSDESQALFSTEIDDWDNYITFERQEDGIIISGDFGKYGERIEAKFSVTSLQRLASTWIDLIDKDRTPEVVEFIQEQNGFAFISCKGKQVSVLNQNIY